MTSAFWEGVFRVSDPKITLASATSLFLGTDPPTPEPTTIAS